MEILGLQRHWVCGQKMSLGMWEEFMEEQQVIYTSLDYYWKNKRAYFYLEQLS